MTIVESTTSPKRLVWPPICANCAGPAADRLTIARVSVRQNRLRHRRSFDDPTLFRVTAIDVPFCAACVARHREAVVEISPLRRALTVFYTTSVIPLAVCVVGVALFFNPSVLGPPENRIVVTPNTKQLLFFIVFGVVAGWAAWYSTRRFRVPAESEISRAFDFSETPGYFWQPLKRTYRLRNETFGAAFAAANARDDGRSAVRRV